MIALIKKLFKYYKAKKALKNICNINGCTNSIMITLDEDFNITYINNIGKKLLCNEGTSYFEESNYEFLTFKTIKEIKSDLDKEYIWKGKAIIKKKDDSNSIEYNSIMYRISNGNQYVVIFKEESINEDKELYIKDREEDKMNESRYSKLFNLCTDLIYIVKMDGLEIIDANLATCKYLNINKANILGKSVRDVFKEEFMIKQHVIDMIKTNRAPQRQEFSTINNEEKNYFEINYSPICEEDSQVWGILCLARNITEGNKIVKLEMEKEKSKRLLEEIKQYDKIKTEFFANISHELRTPINVIFSAIQVMDIYKNNPEYSQTQYVKYSKMMKQNCYRLLRVVNNLIDITKIDSGFFNVNIGNYEIIKILEDITLAVVEHASHKGISIIFDTFTEEKMIACDPDKIERIMLNLLSNAIKFTDFGGKVYINVKGNRDGYIYIHVKDNGRGIPKEKVDVIFERFLQVDKSLARDHEGTGIGLYLVKLLVELQGGNIQVSSEINKGTEFIVKIPDRTVKYVGENLGKRNIEEKVERINLEFSDIYDININ